MPSRYLFVLPVLLLAAGPVRAQDAPKDTPEKPATGLPSQVDWKFHFDAGWGGFGFGNSLYLRGEGPGLSWDRGVLMECTGDDRWTYTVGESIRPVVFKFLINDMTWSNGEDYTAKPGSTTVCTPQF